MPVLLVRREPNDVTGKTQAPLGDLALCPSPAVTTRV
jgi:hypothetical protein